MGRHKKSVNRPVMPDEKYNSVVISKFVTRMMLDGKKQTCLNIVYEALDKLKGKITVHSELHQGTSFELSLPASLATQDGMIVSVSNNSYLIRID